MPVNFCAMGTRGGSIVTSPPVALSLIAGSVGAGGVNVRADVILIQSLLNLVPAAFGGPSPLLKADGIAGPLTIAAIRRFQSVAIGPSDGRVDPGGKTLTRLKSSGAVTGQRFGVVGAPGPKPAPLAAAIAATPTAKLWTLAAIAHLDGLEKAFLASGGQFLLPLVFNIVNTHFHLDRDPSSIVFNLGKAKAVFNRIFTMLSDPGTFYREGLETEKSKFADAPMGGFFQPEPLHHITIRTQYPDCGPNCQAAMLVHEGAHFCGGLNEIRHFAHEFPVPNGEPQDGSAHNYEQMTTSEALRNAASYAAFAIHVFFFQDLRFGLDKKSQ